MAVPLRQAMEVKIAKEVRFRPPAALTSQELHHPAMLSATPSGLPIGGTHNLALEILQGKDEALDEADFMSGGADLREILDVNAVMERSRGI
jgi:proteasome maturation protein